VTLDLAAPPGDPLTRVLRQLSARAQSPRVAAWAQALLLGGEAASGRVGGLLCAETGKVTSRE
jgi:hypothetical protein